MNGMMRMAIILLLSLSTVPFLPTTQAQTSEDLVVHFINAGRDSILLDYGELEMLVDGGNYSEKASSYIAPYIQSPLEIVLATHQHKDHVGGLLPVLAQEQVSQIIWNGDEGGNGSSFDWTREAFLSAARTEPGANLRVVGRGDIIAFGPMSIAVLNPPGLIWPGSANDMSLVLRFTWGVTTFLLMGDAQWRNAEPDMLAQGINVKADVYKLGHHGLKNATSKPFALAVNPKVVVNQSSLPQDSVMQALGQLSPPVPIYYTNKHGHIIFKVTPTGYTLTTTKAHPPVYSPYRY